MTRREFVKLLFVLGVIGCPSSNLGIPQFLYAQGRDDGLELALQAQDFLESGDYEKSLSLLTRAKEIDPHNNWIWGLLGRVYTKMNHQGEAVYAFRQAVRITPADTYSKMMIDILTQNPVKRVPRGRKAVSALERKAIEEENQVLALFVQEQKEKRYVIRKIVIDPGHGGFDPGAVGQGGLKEKDVALDIAKKLCEKVKNTGSIRAFMTRYADYYVPLSERTAIANQYQADVFVSIHINASENRKAGGSETYFCSERASSKEAARVAAFENSVAKYDKLEKKIPGFIDIEDILFKFERSLYWQESQRVANICQSAIGKHLELKSRGVHSANFYVLRKARMPSILVECGFISNSAEEQKLRTEKFRKHIVATLFQAIDSIT